MSVELLISIGSNGTHWIFYYKNSKVKYYFDTIDKPLKEIVTFLGKNNMCFNDDQIQDYNGIMTNSVRINNISMF